VRTRGLVIFDAFNTLVTARRGSERTFLTGLAQAGLDATASALAELQAASEGLDHPGRSASRQAYVAWATGTLRGVRQGGLAADASLAACVVPALEQLHQAPMVALPGAAACLRSLRSAGFTIAVCSNWGWDLAADLEGTGLTGDIDVLVTSAQAGCRKPHRRIYQETLDLAGFGAADAVFVGDSLRTDVEGPRRAGVRSVLLAPEPVDRFAGERAATLAEVTRLLAGGATGP
jgi:putative hydrolase of the HAD superfamily